MRVLQGFLLSLIFHLFLVLLMQVLPAPYYEPKSVTIDIIEKPQASSHFKTPQNIVRDATIPDRLKAEDSQDPLRFLSEKTQRVKEQVRALQSGLTKNRGSRSVNSQEALPKSQAQTTGAGRRGIQQFLPGTKLIPKPTSEVDANESGASTFGNILDENVKVGSVTALNTDRYLYYSYFARAEELLRNEWEPQILQVYDYPPSELRGSSQRRFTTVLEVWFLPSGEYHSTHILKPSGVKAFDMAATESFRRVRMIPNPPRERIEADGLIRFKWSLTVEYNPKVLVRQTN